jgi:hypothetical protein
MLTVGEHDERIDPSVGDAVVWGRRELFKLLALPAGPLVAQGIATAM